SEDKLGGAVTAGLGAGIRSRWLRTDLTFDYGGAQKYQGTIATTNDTSAKIQAHNLLFNGYIDLGTWTLLTPYIGAGLGAAYVRTSEYSSTGAPPFTPVPANTQWNFAWALMAGAAFQVAPNLQIDAGYRFLSVGDAKTGADAFGRRMTFRDVHNHEIRVGLRWSYDDLRPLQ
ncbi:MAG: porin family protein, partial [Pseudolabrys sp.]|nr:porin family protein [Pseudolabrys sp.]